ncbi:MAG: GH25 family lysozyme [Bacilli bacterium]
MKKIVITLTTLLIILTIVMLLIKHSYKKNKIEITLSKQDIEVYENIELKDLINEEINLLNNYKINTETVGEQNIEVKYKNKIFKYKENIKINIVDIENPVILVGNKWVEEKSDIDLVNSFLCADNYDARPNCKIEGNYDLNTPGEYNLKYIATDSSNNKTEKDFILNVYKKPEPEENPKPQEESFVDFQDIIKLHKGPNTSIGIDVSKWQGNIDFEKVKQAGCEFVIIKAAGSYIDGELYTDPRFFENIENALKNNLKVGVYFNSDANSVEMAKQEIDYTLNLIKDYDIELGIAYDWENFTDFNTYNISLHTLNEMSKVFLDEVQNKGYKPILYSSKYYLENLWDKNYDIWVAQYADNNTYEGEYIMWQQCSDGIIDGINAYVDIDIMYK